jgi:imidazolonepropionase
MIKVYRHLSQVATLSACFKKDGRNLVPQDLSLISSAAVVFDDHEILWLGPDKDLPAEFNEATTFHLEGHVLTPEIVDAHTHLIFGGDRSAEYAERLNGVSYEDIARRGGGILFTMKETNLLASEVLYQKACERIERINRYGVGTIEIKSGYGLNFEKEKEISLVIDRLKKKYAPRIQIYNTYMAAHDVPKNFKSSSEYLHKVVIPLLTELAPLGIIDAVDIFHEKKYFTDQDVNDLFIHSQSLGISAKMHADELHDNGGGALSVAHNCLSADHLLKISDASIEALKHSKTVATLLPGTAFFIGKPLAPARKMLDAGLKVAIASDYNPGSCHCDNLLLLASVSAQQMKLNQAELWCGITMNAAHALGKNDQGAIEVGLKPRFSLFGAHSLAEITYHWGVNLAVSLP